MCCGLTRGIMPTVFQRSHAVRTRIAKKASGSQVVAKSAADWNQSPTISLALSAAGTDPLTELGRHLRCAPELDAVLPPECRAGLGSRVVEAPRGVLDEDD